MITASDGIDGIAVFLKEQIDLILLDILLPKMDGYAVCELIRKNRCNHYDKCIGKEDR